MKLKMLLRLSCFWLLTNGAFAGRRRHRFDNNKANPLRSQQSYTTSEIREELTTSGKDTTADTENIIFLRVTSHMKDQNATSGGSVHFKCKVDGWPKDSIDYTWYFEDAPVKDDPRFTITIRPWGSRLRITDAYTHDSGFYRCEASNGLRRVQTSAHLTVSFELPPQPTEDEIKLPDLLTGKCEAFTGTACRNFLHGTNIYVDEFENQGMMEEQVKRALGQLTDQTIVSEECRKFAAPAFCFFAFPTCHVNENDDVKRMGRLCREDCQLLKRDICHKEYLQRNKNPFLTDLFNATNCSLLPSAEDSECTRVGLFSGNPEQNCYYDKGEEYRGTIDVSEIGTICKTWPSFMSDKFSELAGGHNFCRNPGNNMDKPWCFVDSAKTRRVACGIEKCKSDNKSEPNLTLTIAIVACAGTVVVMVTIAFVLSRRFCQKKRCRFSSRSQHVPEILQVQMPLMVSQKSLVPHLQSTSIQLLSEIGNGEYGKIYKGLVPDDPRFPCKQQFAMKVLKDNFTADQVNQFKCEMKVLSDLKHSKITCLKAVVLQPNFYCMVLEHSDQTDLHEHLVLNSPNSDVTKHVTANGHGSSSISNADFFKMASQIASGMEYLSSNNYIHRDLAARNVLVCGNMDLKICNLGVVRDSYLSSYYRSRQGRLWPIRWMAPESLQSWQFSDKSAVWSFGVLLWEMFSYGLQPYCGYSNHEVLDMISRRQLLTCPDQCPAKMYSLMHECWAAQPEVRPCFQVLWTKLQTYSKVSKEPLIVKSVELRRIPKASICSPSPPPEYTTHPNSYAPSCSDNGTSSEISFASSDVDTKTKEPHFQENQEPCSSSDPGTKQVSSGKRIDYRSQKS